MNLELMEKYHRKIGCRDLFVFVDYSIEKEYNQMIQSVLRTYTRVFDSTVPLTDDCFYILSEIHKGVFPLEQSYIIYGNDDNWMYGLINDLDVFYEEKIACVAVHGACISINNKSILIIGKRWSGKTTLAHFLLGISNGKYMSDDCVYVQNNFIFGFCTPIPIRDYNKTITDRSDEVLDTIDDGDGVKRTLVVPPQIIASMNRIDYIVFPQYNPNCIGEIKQVKSVDLINKIICNVRSYNNMSELLGVISNLAKEAKSYYLKYSNSDMAYKLLNEYNIL